MSFGRAAFGTQPLGIHLGEVSPVGLATPLRVVIQDDGTTYVHDSGGPMTQFSIKKGDRYPALAVQLVDKRGVKPSLTGATVLFVMRDVTTASTVISATCSIVDASSAQVSYAWDADDTTSVMEGNGEFQVTYASGLKQTFPNPGFIAVHITDNAS